jgi:hypothetical protein
VGGLAQRDETDAAEINIVSNSSGPQEEWKTLPDGRKWWKLTSKAKAKIAETLVEFRGQYRYNLLDSKLRRRAFQVGREHYDIGNDVFEVMLDSTLSYADYDRTLLAWWRNFDAAWPELKSRYGNRFYRMWRYCLLSYHGRFPPEPRGH